MSWDNRKHWPVSYRSQHDAGLPPGPINGRPGYAKREMLFAGILIGLLLIGPALADFWSML